MIAPRSLILLACLIVPWAAQAQDCFRSSIQDPAPFLGNHGEIFTLVNGTIWQIVGAYEYMYQYYPAVVVCPQQAFIVVNGKQIGILYMGKIAR